MPASSLTDDLHSLSGEQQQYLLQLALRSINSAFENKPELPGDLRGDNELAAIGACFVTLEKQQQLRGCIGSLLARRPLTADVWFNAQSAAFHDPRFAALTPDELPSLTFSLSLLGRAMPLTIHDEKDLLRQLVPLEHGVIIECDHHRATFLPQVWAHFADAEDFLMALRQKADLAPAFDQRQRYSVYRCLSIK